MRIPQVNHAVMRRTRAQKVQPRSPTTHGYPPIRRGALPACPSGSTVIGGGNHSIGRMCWREVLAQHVRAGPTDPAGSLLRCRPPIALMRPSMEATRLMGLAFRDALPHVQRIASTAPTNPPHDDPTRRKLTIDTLGTIDTARAEARGRTGRSVQFVLTRLQARRAHPGLREHPAGLGRARVDHETLPT